MRVSLRWLADYVDVDVPPEKLRDLLDMSGTKVETITRPGRDIEGVIVAEVKAIDPHPNADNLSLVEVDAGDGPQQVVCGAHNFAVGDRVPLATVGGRLPGLEIGARKIRGIESRGMLCSGRELGVSKDHSGILVLPDEAEPGEPVTSVLGLDDTIFELEITPNRPDCMGLIGIAREVAALLGAEHRVPEVPSLGSRTSPVSVDIQDADACPRYVARFIAKTKVGPSPAWLARRLIAAGMRPISNVVDVTNYVMLETGQPLHAFDARLVEAGSVTVRRSARGERLEFLDGIERKLQRDDLVIADATGPLALAGVMGGRRSEVTGTTTAVVLEAACFDPATVSFAGRRHGLRTEASIRFERGVDVESTEDVSRRAAALIAEVTGGDAGFAASDVYPAPRERVRLRLRPIRTNRLLGLDVPAERQAGHLRSVGMAVTAVEGDLQVEVPAFRPDVTREVDLIEEIARLAGYASIPSTVPPGGAGGLTPGQKTERVAITALAARGVHEAWTTSFASPADLDRLGLPAEHPARAMVMLANPMGDEEPGMRTTLLPGLLRSARHNLAHQAPGVALFELARVYEEIGGEDLPREATILGAVFAGSRVEAAWTGPQQEWDFYAVRSVVDGVARALGIPPLSYQATDRRPFHPTRAASISLGSSAVGIVGELHPSVCYAFEVPEHTVAAELSFRALVAAVPPPSEVGELPRHPSASIDLAVVVDEQLPAATIHDMLARAGAPELASIRLFDVYRGDQVAAGKKSLAFALELRKADGTLTDAEALDVRDRMVSALASVGAELRA